MKASNALNLLLAIALVLMSVNLYILSSSRKAESPFEAGTAAEAEAPVRDFHGGATLPPPPPAPAPGGQSQSASDFALAALGVTADAITAVPKADATTSATPAAPEADAALRPFDVRKEFDANPFDIFTGKGMLVCAGDREKSNAMTIGWGGLGTLWGRNDAVTVYVAEKRHTKLFMDKAAYFTVMAFDKEKQADILDYMGRNSGRDGDKAAALGLHLAYTGNGTPYYEEAEMVLECEMMYSAPFDPAGMRDVPRNLYAHFPAGVHTMYIGRIVAAMRKPQHARKAP